MPRPTKPKSTRPRVNIQLPAAIEEFVEQRMEETLLPKSSVIVMMLKEYVDSRKLMDSLATSGLINKDEMNKKFLDMVKEQAAFEKELQAKEVKKNAKSKI